MRTTLTLDDDVAAKLDGVAHKKKLPFKRVVNEALRAGLTQMEHPCQPKRYKLKTFKMGFSPAYNWDKALSIAAEIEDEEILRKMSLRK